MTAAIIVIKYDLYSPGIYEKHPHQINDEGVYGFLVGVRRY